VRVIDAAGKELGAGRDLRALKGQFGEAAQLTFSASDPGIERTGLRAWDCGELPAALSFIRDGRRLTGFPALVDEGENVALRLLDTAEAAERAHRRGVLRLLRIALREQIRILEKGWPNFNAVALQLRARISPDRLLADWMETICERAFIGEDQLPRDGAQFEGQKQRARARLAAVRDGAQRQLAEIAAAYAQLSAALGQAPLALQKKARALEVHRDRLIFPGFMQELGWTHLAHLPRYLNGILRRYQKYPENPDRDGRNSAIIEAWHQRWLEQIARAVKAGQVAAKLQDFRWWIEELAVALFAQELKTPFPVSHKRLEKRWSELTR
jgi:ATP-dependent helicase HrpA